MAETNDERPLSDSALTEEEVPRAPESPTPGVDTFPSWGLAPRLVSWKRWKRFLTPCPPILGMAFVVVTHQASARVSLLPELLRNHTTMVVCEVTAGVPVVPNTIYLPQLGPHLACSMPCSSRCPPK